MARWGYFSKNTIFYDFKPKVSTYLYSRSKIWREIATLPSMNKAS